MTRRTAQRLVAAGALVAMTLAAYIPVTANGFIWDDDRYVTENPTLESLTGLGRIWAEFGATDQYYPLTYTTFWLERRAYGLNPVGYHVVNVLLHTATVLLLWQVLRVLSVPGAWLAAAIFAVHPVHVESVAWVTERKNVLSGVLYMGSLLAYLRFARLGSPSAPVHPRWRWYAVALVLFVLALLSKTVTCSLPAVILLVAWWKRDRLQRADVVPLLPMFVIGAALAMVTAWVEKAHVGATGAAWDLSWVDRCLIAGRVLWFYAGKLVWPARLTFIYPRWEIDPSQLWQYAYPAAACAVVAVLWALRHRVGKGPLVAVLAFAGTLVPALGFFDVYLMQFSFVADHFQYLASIGLIVLAGAALSHVPRVASRPLAAALLVALGILTWRQAPAYADEETLWRSTIAKNPTAWIAYNNLGTCAHAQGDLDEAESCYRTALRLNELHAAAHANLGTLLTQRGRLAEAARHLHRALELAPENPAALDSLGVLHVARGERKRAAALFRETLSIDPDYALAHQHLGRVLFEAGAYDEAVEHLRAAAGRTPHEADVQYQLGVSLFRLGRPDDAMEALKAAVALKPKLALAHTYLGILLAEKGETPAAREQLVRAVRLAPDAAMPNLNLGVFLAQQGEGEAALERLRFVVQSNPDDAKPLVCLADVQEDLGRARRAAFNYRRALELAPDNIDASRKLAWILATHPAADVRDGLRAVALAKRACAGDAANPRAWDTLAAAYAEAGRFADALEAVDKALKLPAEDGHADAVQGIAERKRCYRAGQPYRNPRWHRLATKPTSRESGL
jgi:tetratricopeptide (TPR) repeat protein